MAINKLNKTFEQEQVLKAEEMNQLSSKIDEIITEVNKQETTLDETSTLLDNLNGEII